MTLPGKDLQSLQAEVIRQQKVIKALMDRAERKTSFQSSDFSLFQSTVMLEEQVRRRTAELELALHENEEVTRALRESETKFQRLVENSMVGITLTDHLSFYYVNPMFCSITGYTVKELTEMNLLDITSPSHRDKLSEMIKDGLQGEAVQADFFTEIVRKDDTIVQVEITGGLPVSYNGKPVLVYSIIDVTERIRAENEIKLLNTQLKELSTRDPLTGLYNRRYLDDMLVREFKRTQRSGEKLSLIMSDLDHFKRVNDDYGHQTGDAVLAAFARLLVNHTRTSDICCRYGGEEFLLMMFNIAGQDVHDRIELLRQSVENETILFAGETLHFTASFGIASYPDGITTPEELLANADMALYKAKEAGRNRISIAQ